MNIEVNVPNHLAKNSIVALYNNVGLLILYSRIENGNDNLRNKFAEAVSTFSLHDFGDSNFLRGSQPWFTITIKELYNDSQSLSSNSGITPFPLLHPLLQARKHIK